MPDAYQNHDGQFLQSRVATSSVAGLSAALGPVPVGKIWTILAAAGVGSTAETQTFWWAIVFASFPFPVSLPQSFSVAPAVNQSFPLLSEGNELKLFQGEYLNLYRAAATAGSTISIYARLIETDMEFYRETDKHQDQERFKRSLVARGLIGRGGRAIPAARPLPGPPGRGGGLER